MPHARPRPLYGCPTVKGKSMRNIIIAANWKMHKTVPESVEFIKTLHGKVPSTARTVIVAAPFTALYRLSQAMKGTPFSLAGQNLHEEEQGAYTGEIAAGMLVDAGCRHVIVGHSERRHLFNEPDERINKKIVAALRAGLTPIFCIGETLSERDSGNTFHVIDKQINKGLNNVAADDIGRLIIAYEPVWAIGTGKTATRTQAEKVHRYIRETIGEKTAAGSHEDIAIIYGGSVTAGNVTGLLEEPNIDGVLVGGASLDAGTFAEIING